MNGSWIENYQFQRGVPMRLADMTPEQRRYWQNVNASRASRRRQELRAPDPRATGGKPAKAGQGTAHRKMTDRARKAKQQALEDHAGSDAMIAARALQVRGHVVYSLAIMGDTYGGPMRDLWVVDLRDHPVPTDTMIAWSKRGVPSREDRIAAAVPIIRPAKKKAPVLDRAAEANALIEDAMRRYKLTRNAVERLIGMSVLYTLEKGGVPTTRTVARIRRIFEDLEGGHVEGAVSRGSLLHLIETTLDRYGISATTLERAAMGCRGTIARIRAGAIPIRETEEKLRTYIAKLEAGEVTL